MPLACDGLAPTSDVTALHERAAGSDLRKSDDPETSLKALKAAEVVVQQLDGGRGCDVLHTHEATDYRRVVRAPPASTPSSDTQVCYWVDVPFVFDDEAARDAAFDVARRELACDLRRTRYRPSGLDYSLTPPSSLVAFLREPVARVASEYRSCCVRRDGPHDWCDVADCRDHESLGAFAERRGDAMLRALGPGEACATALRPLPTRADLRVVSALVPDFEVLHLYDPNMPPDDISDADYQRAYAATALDAQLVAAAVQDEVRVAKAAKHHG